MVEGGGLSKAQIRFWLSSEILLTQVAEFLTLEDLGRLLTAHPEFLSVTFVPTPTRIAEIVLRAPRPGSRVDPKCVVIRDVRNGKVTKEASYNVLSALHGMLLSIPTDCELPAEFSGIHAQRQDGELSLCSFTTTPLSGVHQSAEVVLASKRCEGTAQGGECRRDVFVECRACKEICCACSHHQARCELTQHNVCPSCIVPSGGGNIHGQQPAMCTACGFQCFACAEALPNGEQFKCNSGAGCLTPNKLCHHCVFDEDVLETTWCERCHRTWCLGCVEFPPPCAHCGGQITMCAECAETSECENCDAVFHNECFWDTGGMLCEACYSCLCENCRGLPIVGGFQCCYEDCENAMCLACAAQDRTRVCELGHTCCNICVKLCVNWCDKMEATYGGRIVEVDRSCFQCCSEAYARLKGFDDYDHFCRGLYSIPADIKEIGDDLKGAVQAWSLGGRGHLDTKKFNTCTTLWDQLESASEGLFNDAPPISIKEILSQLTLTSVTAWEKSFVNGVQASLSLVNRKHHPSANTPLTTTNAWGNHDEPTQRTLILDHDNDERVASIHVRYGVIVDNLRIVTTTGREMTWGGPGGDETTNYRVPEGWKLVGFFGGVGGHLHKLGVVIVADPAAVTAVAANET